MWRYAGSLDVRCVRTWVCNPAAVQPVEELHARSKGYSTSVTRASGSIVYFILYRKTTTAWSCCSAGMETCLSSRYYSGGVVEREKPLQILAYAITCCLECGSQFPCLWFCLFPCRFCLFPSRFLADSASPPPLSSLFLSSQDPDHRTSLTSISGMICKNEVEFPDGPRSLESWHAKWWSAVSFVIMCDTWW